MNTKPIKSALPAPFLLAVSLGGVILLQGCTNPGSKAGDTTATAPTAAGSPGAAGTPGAMTGHEGHDHAAPGHEGHDHAMPAGGAKMNHAMGETGMQALQPLKGKAFDIAFMSQMIAHHEAALQMGEQALKSSQQPTTRAEAQKIVTSQSAEIKQMTDWLKKWYGVAPSPEQQALVNADMKSMMAMPLTSDQMFFAMMIPHHQGAIKMSKLVPERSERAEVKQLAEKIIASQEQEVQQYQRLIGSP